MRIIDRHTSGRSSATSNSSRAPPDRPAGAIRRSTVSFQAEDRDQQHRAAERQAQQAMLPHGVQKLMQATATASFHSDSTRRPQPNPAEPGRLLGTYPATRSCRLPLAAQEPAPGSAPPGLSQQRSKRRTHAVTLPRNQARMMWTRPPPRPRNNGMKCADRSGLTRQTPR